MADIKKDILLRVYFVYALIFLFAMAIMGRVFQLQYVEGDYWKQRSDSLTLAYKTIEPSRGNIFMLDCFRHCELKLIRN